MHFHKWLPVLAVMVLFTASTSAQSFSCTATAGATPTVRYEGLTELVGDVLMFCMGGPAVPTTILANFQISLNTNITSKILETTNNTMDALLLLDDPGSPGGPSVVLTGPNQNVFKAQKVSDDAVAWYNVPINVPIPAGSTRVIRITNVRANANQIGLSSTLLPNPIIMYISTSDSSMPVPVYNAQPVVAYVQQGMKFVARNCADSDYAFVAFEQCIDTNKDLVTDPTKTGQTIHYILKYTEGFANAFKTRGDTTQTIPGGNQSLYVNTESGLTVNLGGGVYASYADTGTRLIARFNNIPAGVWIYVTSFDTRTGVGATTVPKDSNTGVAGTSNTIAAALVSTSDPTGVSGAPISGGIGIIGSGTANCSNWGGNAPIVPVVANGGSGSAVWEIRYSVPGSAPEKISFGVAVAYKANVAAGSPALGDGYVTGNLAPVSSLSAWGQSSSSAPIPRFADVPIQATAVRIYRCAGGSAQSFSCTPTASATPTVRYEGLTELVGDVVMYCTGGPPTPTTVVANFQIFLNANITSKILDSSNNMDALLLLDDPGSPGGPSVVLTGPNQNVFKAQKVSENAIAWYSIPINVPIPAGSTRVIRITNVRANANQVGLSSALLPNPIIMYISTSGSMPVPMVNPQPVVAYVQQGMKFVARNCADDDDAAPGSSDAVVFAQCSNKNADLTTDPTKTKQAIYYILTYAEGFANAFKTRGDTTQTIPGGNQSLYTNTESGLTIALGGGVYASYADTGTRLIARFNNIPTGVWIYITSFDTRTGVGATTAPKDGNTGVKGTSDTIAAALVSTSDPTGISGASISPAIGIVGSATAKCDSWSDYASIVPVVANGGSGSAVWEIRYSVPGSAPEKISFGVAIAYKVNVPAGTPAVGDGYVTGNLAPVSSLSAWTKSSTSAPIPRFADVPIQNIAVRILQCLTNLLFPFVTNNPKADWDTGVVISNTSKDIFDTGNQAGACTINYFGPNAPSSQTSAVVNVGEQLVFTLYYGGTHGILPTQGFQGYLIVQCKFQYAHGYAFISDNGAQKLAQGYLALIFPSRGGSGAEQLVH
jgi:hypothetical protein